MPQLARMPLPRWHDAAVGAAGAASHPRQLYTAVGAAAATQPPPSEAAARVAHQSRPWRSDLVSTVEQHPSQIQPVEENPWWRPPCSGGGIGLASTSLQRLLMHLVSGCCIPRRQCLYRPHLKVEAPRAECQKQQQLQLLKFASERMNATKNA
ncbi:hypothetical protein U9M48_039244 [Paspalum notatum var. saurae]|uniref:Uncharacterized protein n=1 Tax=Paspalum notatum var. saurae TaxID=547442 RepID=A0AAQ3XB81_PASNO